MLSTADHEHLAQPIDTQIDDASVDTNLLLHDLLQSDRPLIEIAASHKLKLSQLLVWCAQPAIRSLLLAADELALRRASHTAAQSRHLALTVLAEQCRALYETPTDRTLANRAARALLRTIESGSAPRPARPPHAPLRHPSHHPIEPSPATPPSPTPPNTNAPRAIEVGPPTSMPPTPNLTSPRAIEVGLATSMSPTPNFNPPRAIEVGPATSMLPHPTTKPTSSTFHFSPNLPLQGSSLIPKSFNSPSPHAAAPPHAQIPRD